MHIQVIYSNTKVNTHRCTHTLYYPATFWKVLWSSPALSFVSRVMKVASKFTGRGLIFSVANKKDFLSELEDDFGLGTSDGGDLLFVTIRTKLGHKYTMREEFTYVTRPNHTSVHSAHLCDVTHAESVTWHLYMVFPGSSLYCVCVCVCVCVCLFQERWSVLGEVSRRLLRRSTQALC